MMKLRSVGFGMEQLREWSLRHPDQARAQDYLHRVSGPPDRAAVEAAAAKFRWHMTHLEDALAASGGPWICGPDYSLADICVAPILDRVESLDLARLWADLPAVGAWYRADEGAAGLPAGGTALRLPHVGPAQAAARPPGRPGSGGQYIPGGLTGTPAGASRFGDAIFAGQP